MVSQLCGLTGWIPTVCPKRVCIAFRVIVLVLMVGKNGDICHVNTFSSLDDPSLNMTEIYERLDQLQKELQTTKERVDLIERGKLENECS